MLYLYSNLSILKENELVSSDQLLWIHLFSHDSAKIHIFIDTNISSFVIF